MVDEALALADRTCPTCSHTGPPDDFYNSSPECRKCKRNRSRANRAAVADKVALADRLLAIVERLAGDGHNLCLACDLPPPSQEAGRPRILGAPTPPRGHGTDPLHH